MLGTISNSEHYTSIILAVKIICYQNVQNTQMRNVEERKTYNREIKQKKLYKQKKCEKSTYVQH